MNRALTLRIAAAFALVIAVSLGLAQWAELIDLLREHGLGGDFTAHYDAGRWWAEGGGTPLYPTNITSPASAVVNPYANPPYAALPFVALASMAPVSAYRVFAAALFMVLFATIAKFVRDQRHWSRPERAGAALAVFTSPVSVGQIILGTVTLPVVALHWIIARRDSDRDSWLTGIMVGLLTYKPQYAIAPLVVLLARRRWRAVGGALVTTATLIGGTVAVHGISLWQNYANFSKEFAAAFDNPAPATPSFLWVPVGMPVIRGLLAHLLGLGNIALLNTISTVVLLVGAAVTYAAARRLEPRLAWSVALLVGFATSMHSNTADAVVLFVPLALLYDVGRSANAAFLRRVAVTGTLALPIAVGLWPQIEDVSFPVPALVVLTLTLVSGLGAARLAASRRDGQSVLMPVMRSAERVL